MSSTNTPSGFTVDTEFNLNDFFDFSQTGNAVEKDSFPPPRLDSPFSGLPDGVQEQSLGWQSPSAAAIDNSIANNAGLNNVNFSESGFLDGSNFNNTNLDGVGLNLNDFDSTNVNFGHINVDNTNLNGLGFTNVDGGNVSIDNAGPNDFSFTNGDLNFANVDFANTNFSEPGLSSVPAKDSSDATALEVAQRELEASRQEIAKLRAALAAATTRQQPPVISGRVPQSNSRKRKSFSSSDSSPPKRQKIPQSGTIETLWSLPATKGEGPTRNLASPKTPKPSSAHLDLTPPSSGNYKSNAVDHDISPANLRSLQTFINNDTLPNNAMPPTLRSSSTAGQLTNMEVNPTAPKKAAKRAPKTTPKESTTTKVVKKNKATPEKVQQQRATSASASASPDRPRPIEELLAANFNSLNAQEKTRVLLPLLRKMDPRQLEASLAELPCIQAKGPGHEVRVAAAIFNSPPTPEADDYLASALTYGVGVRAPPATPAAEELNEVSPVPSVESPLSSRPAPTEVGEQLGAARQRKAIEKAALLDAQGKKR